MIPLLGYIITLLIKPSNEKVLAFVAVSTMAVQLISLVGFILLFTSKQIKFINLNDFTVYSGHGYQFYIDLFFDYITAVYALVGGILGLLITLFSRRYLHRESGYKRFFNTLLFFYFGYNVAIFAGNFETLFIGWEVLGISSFLLIAFYRERYLPVKNALKVFFLYRIGDVGMILAMWLSHHLWHENISFARLQNLEIVHHQISNHSIEGVAVAMLLLIAAMVKSAAWPFSSWLPRAMEGPTPSSAIFYGSLSVHLGVFVLLRTYPLYEFQNSVLVIIGVIGLLTSVIGYQISRVQSSIKSQIAYGSISQIGLIFIEIALGWHVLALIHFAGNAFLRTYQLLISPSVAVYSIRRQQYLSVTNEFDSTQKLNRIKSTLLVLGLKEFNMEEIQYKLLWRPLKKLGKIAEPLSYQWIFIFLLIWTVISGAILNISLPAETSILFGFISVLLVLKAFSEYRQIKSAWWGIFFSHLSVVLALNILHPGLYLDSFLYLSGALISSVLGYWVIIKLQKSNESLELNSFKGLIEKHPKLGFVFLVSCLGISGFPITPTFIGEDLIFSHIKESEFILAIFVSLTFILNGLAAIRIYARLFLVQILVRNKNKYKTA